MRVVLTGASGFIGSVICMHLKTAGHEVGAVVRSTSRTDHIKPFVSRFIEGSWHSDSDIEAIMNVKPACIIHNGFDWAALKESSFDDHLRINLAGSLRLLKASTPAQFIFMSSVAVHHDMRPRWQGVIDEDHPLRPASLYGACKAAIEAHLWSAHFGRKQNTCAFRPCAVYGIDPKIERSHGYDMIQSLRRERKYAKPGGGKFVHVDDVADAVVQAVGREEGVAGRAFNLADCYARWGDLAQMAAELMKMSDVNIDLSSPDHPVNTFSREAVNRLGIALNRGHDGIRRHLHELIEMTG